MNTDFALGLSEMTPFEIGDLAMSIYSVQIELFVVYLSVLSAYLAVAYLVGKKLTIFQLYSISTIYSVFMVTQILSIIQVSNMLQGIVAYAAGASTAALAYPFFIIMITAWVISLLFMRHCRTLGDT